MSALIPRTGATTREEDLTMDAGQKLKRARERLDLRFRDVVEASQKISEIHNSTEYLIALSQLSAIENQGLVPNVYRIYSLCAIYRLDILEVLEWYQVPIASLPADAAQITHEQTHIISFRSTDHYEGVQIPITLDPGLDLKRTTFLSRMIQRWGKLPLALLSGADVRSRRYGFIGSEDWSMYPLIQPGSLVLIDDTVRKISAGGWTNEFERPIYFFEHREGYACSWCTLADGRLILQPHPASMVAMKIFAYPAEIELIGQVTGVAMRLDQGSRRHTGS